MVGPNTDHASRPSRAKPGAATFWIIGILLVCILILAFWWVISAQRADAPDATESTHSAIPIVPIPALTDEPGSGTAGPATTPSGTNAKADVALARQVLNEIPVKGRAPKTGYSREEFGKSWPDIDGNGCDTRNDILQRDLEDVRLSDDCLVETGVLVDPFSGDTVPFQRGTTTSREVQIDHMVSLSNAWQTGAQQFTDTQREQFANDPSNLLAVRGDLNAQKSNGDAATWLPPDKSFRCEFVAIQVLVKHDHGLWLTAPEKAAMIRIRDRC